jgi:hypothetical protein
MKTMNKFLAVLVLTLSFAGASIAADTTGQTNVDCNGVASQTVPAQNGASVGTAQPAAPSGNTTKTSQ